MRFAVPRFLMNELQLRTQPWVVMDVNQDPHFTADNRAALARVDELETALRACKAWLAQEEEVGLGVPDILWDIILAALRDPDAQPLTEADLARMKRVPRIKTLRRALGLTQEEFAARYHIPLGTLRDWEQGRCEPDQPARAYLTVIAHDPEGVRKALQAGPH